MEWNGRMGGWKGEEEDDGWFKISNAGGSQLKRQSSVASIPLPDSNQVNGHLGFEWAAGPIQLDRIYVYGLFIIAQTRRPTRAQLSGWVELQFL